MEHTHQEQPEQPEQLEQLEQPEQLKQPELDELDEQDETKEEIFEWDLQKQYDEMLDECYPMAVVGGLEYYPSNVLEKCDPIAYRCGFHDWICSEGWEEHPTDDHKYIRTVSY